MVMFASFGQQRLLVGNVDPMVTCHYKVLFVLKLKDSYFY